MMPVKALDTARVRDNFSGHAADYDRYASVQRRVVGLLHGKLQNYPLAPGLLLDVGTGTGALARALSPPAPQHHLVVMDLAHGMTRHALMRLPGVSPCDGDARQLPFAAGSFAGVFSSSVYQWVDCLPKAFAEVARILQPGGLFAVALFGGRTLFELRTSHCRAVADCGVQRSSHVQSFPELAEVESALATSGLACRELLSTLEVAYHADVPELLRQLKQIGASNAAADRPGGLASRRVMQRMMAIYEAGYRCAGGLPATYEVIVAIAEKSGE